VLCFRGDWLNAAALSASNVFFFNIKQSWNLTFSESMSSTLPSKAVLLVLINLLKVMEYNLTKHQTLRDIWDVGLLLLLLLIIIIIVTIKNSGGKVIVRRNIQGSAFYMYYEEKYWGFKQYISYFIFY
jgi:predicted neutral ceramidase superfamily lipid hydrolase